MVFAVEIAFLFPWALVLGEALAGTGTAAGTGIGLFALVEGVLFVAILFLGLAYVWAKGDLDWVLAYTGTRYQPKAAGRKAAPRMVTEIEAEREAAGVQSHLEAAHAEPEPAEAGR